MIFIISEKKDLGGKRDYFHRVSLLLKIFFVVSDQVSDFIILITLLIKMKFGFAAVFFAVDLLPGIICVNWQYNKGSISPNFVCQVKRRRRTAFAETFAVQFQQLSSTTIQHQIVA